MNQQHSSENKKETVSVIVPLLNEEPSLAELNQAIEHALTQAGFLCEIIYVDDGSTDDSWQTITRLKNEFSFVRGIRLRRNYGKSAALQEGFEIAKGSYICTIDADLQDDPNELPEMINMLKNGYDLISGWKQKRQDPFSKTIPSRFFNFVTSTVTGIKLHDFNCGLKAYKAEVIHHIRLYGELHRYIPLLAYWEGFTKIGEKKVTHHERKYGHSKFGLSRFVKGFLDLISILFVKQYFQRPMHFFGTLGTLSLFGGTGIVGWLVFSRIFMNQYLSNRPILIIGVLLMVLGMQFFSIGLIGEFIIRKNGVERAQIKEIF